MLVDNHDNNNSYFGRYINRQREIFAREIFSIEIQEAIKE